MYYKRGKNKLQNVYNIADIYPEYVAWVENKEDYTLKSSDFTKVIDAWNKGVVEALYKGKEYIMPAALGSFRIIKSEKHRGFRNVGQIDWQTTAKLGKVVHYKNTHSDGYTYRLYWDRGGFFVTNHSLYYFIPCRDFKRQLAKIIKERKTDYYQK